MLMTGVEMHAEREAVSSEDAAGNDFIIVI
jgi:hypothetical protein